MEDINIVESIRFHTLQHNAQLFQIGNSLYAIG